MKKRFDSVKGVAWLPVVLVAILCAGVLQLIETSYGAEKATIASAEEIPSGVQAQSIPVVSPDQPEVGIEEDHYLDKSPVRETIASKTDLICAPQQHQPTDHTKQPDQPPRLFRQRAQRLKHAFNKRRGQRIGQPLDNQYQPEGQKDHAHYWDACPVGDLR